MNRFLRLFSFQCQLISPKCNKNYDIENFGVFTTDFYQCNIFRTLLNNHDGAFMQKVTLASDQRYETGQELKRYLIIYFDYAFFVCWVCIDPNEIF